MRVTAPELPDAPNCRCTYVPVLIEPEFRSEVSQRAYETATGKLIPDLPTYQEVWEKADVKHPPADDRGQAV
jgi:hypothetical protein